MGEVFIKTGFTVRDKTMIGKWIPIPRWISASPMQWATTSPREEDNMYFVYELEA